MEFFVRRINGFKTFLKIRNSSDWVDRYDFSFRSVSVWLRCVRFPLSQKPFAQPRVVRLFRSFLAWLPGVPLKRTENGKRFAPIRHGDAVPKFPTSESDHVIGARGRARERLRTIGEYFARDFSAFGQTIREPSRAWSAFLAY